MNSISAESAYNMLGQLLVTFPNLPPGSPCPTEALQWIARLQAIASAQANPVDANELRTLGNEAAIGRLNGPLLTAKLYAILYRLLAAAEIQLPAAAQGAFIPAGNVFDAMRVFVHVLGEAKTDVLIVDPYMDANTVTDIASLIPAGVAIRLLSDTVFRKPGLAPAVASWLAQYGQARPLQARLAPAKALHDRAILVDGSAAWALSQSLNAFATRSPATVLRLDAETAGLKLAAYEDMWTNASPIQ